MTVKDDMAANSRQVLSKIEIKPSFNCLCGSVPKVFSNDVCHGQGNNGKEFWVECECGLATKRIDSLVQEADMDRLAAVELWDDLITKFKENEKKTIDTTIKVTCDGCGCVINMSDEDYYYKFSTGIFSPRCECGHTLRPVENPKETSSEPEQPEEKPFEPVVCSDLMKHLVGEVMTILLPKAIESRSGIGESLEECFNGIAKDCVYLAKQIVEELRAL
jgi:hypothetical protein